MAAGGKEICQHGSVRNYGIFCLEEQERARQDGLNGVAIARAICGHEATALSNT